MHRRSWLILSPGRTDHETSLAARREVGKGDEDEDEVEAGEAYYCTECQGCSPSPSLEYQDCRETSERLHFQVWMASFPRVLYTFHRASLTEFFLAVFLLLS